MATITSVRDEGLILEIDGVEYTVNPFDASIAACWYPTMEVEVSDSKVTNKQINQSVRASLA